MKVSEGAGGITVTAGGASFVFGAASGRLEKVEVAGTAMPLANGPRLVAVGVAQDPQEGAVENLAVSHRMLESGACRIEAKSAGAFRFFAWTVNPDGTLDLEYHLSDGFARRFSRDHLRSCRRAGFHRSRGLVRGRSGCGRTACGASRFGSFRNEFRKLRPGVDYRYPHAAGFFAGVREAEIALKAGRITLTTGQDDAFVRIGTNDEGEKVTTSWPDGDFSVLHAIPSIGNKFHKPAEIGPQSMPHPAAGRVAGRIAFRFIPE